jgi:hypothetical protein
MNDTYLLLTGIAVFSLMLIGVVLTHIEYKQLERNSSSSNPEKADSYSKAQKTGTGSESQ